MSSIKYHSGDITKLKVDAIVNAANSSLLGGGGVDGAIHRAAGPGLLNECRTLNGCRTGEAKITGGYNLPAKHVIHTVGPIYSGSISDAEDLRNCYWNSLEVAKANDLHSIAFPGISTGVYGYPKKDAARIALKTVKEWLEANSAYEMEITIVNFSEEDYLIYQTAFDHIRDAFNRVQKNLAGFASSADFSNTTILADLAGEKMSNDFAVRVRNEANALCCQH